MNLFKKKVVRRARRPSLFLQVQRHEELLDQMQSELDSMEASRAASHLATEQALQVAREAQAAFERFESYEQFSEMEVEEASNGEAPVE